MRFRM